MQERTTVRLPSDLLARARKKAAAERRTLTSLIEEGLRAAVDIRAKPGSPRRIVLPVSSATGGPATGIDPDRVFQSVEERDDREYVRRLKKGFK